MINKLDLLSIKGYHDSDIVKEIIHHLLLQ